MYKSSWGWTLGCSEQFEGTRIKLQHWQKKCAYCWFLLHEVEHFMFHLIRSAQCQLSQTTNMTVNFIHVRFYSVQPQDPLFPIETMNSDFTLLPYRETSWSWDKALAFCADLDFEAKYHLLLPPTVKTYIYIYRKYQASTLDQIPHKVMGTSAIYHLHYITSQSPKCKPVKNSLPMF
jgi:hypothetical protein